MKIYKLILLLVLFIASNALFAYEKEVALTIDDLPFVGSANNDAGKLRRENKRFNQILDVLIKDHIPATGFVVANSIEKGQWALLAAFHNSGNLIGNHTYSHMNLNHNTTSLYIENITKADKILRPLMNLPKYFRYPGLAEGANTDKYGIIRHYLAENNYLVAPVTIDSKDFKFNLQLLNIPWQNRKKYLNSFRQRYLNFIWNKTLKAEKSAEKKVHHPIKQILLIHMNTLNSYFLQDVIQLFQKHGYHFISLSAALKDPYYEQKSGRLDLSMYKTQHATHSETPNL